MAEINSTVPDNKTIIRSVSGGSLYALADNVTPEDIRSTLSVKLSQLHAMLVCTHGCGAETFDGWSDEIKDSYLWGASMLTKECESLAEHLA